MKLLVVDDNKYVVEGIKRQLDWEELGIDSVYGCYSVPQAVEILKEHVIDFLITDIEMPGQDGFELLKWLREREMEVDTVLLTSYADFSYTRAAVSFQCFEYLLKPVETTVLREVMEKLVERRNQRERDRRLMEYGNHCLLRRDGEETEGEKETEGETEGQEQEGQEKQLIQEIQKYIREHLDDVSRSQLAEVFFLSPNYLSKLFRKETGDSLSKFIQQERMGKAKRLLKQNKMSISRIAEETGYPSFAHFSKQFKKFVGMSPNEYRRKGEEENGIS